LPWIRRLYHEALKPPVLAAVEPHRRVPHTGLLLPRSLQPQLDALLRSWTVAAGKAVDAFRGMQARRGRDRAGELCAWLRDQRPEVLVTGAEGRLLWDPEASDAIAAVRAALGGIGETAAASVRSDLAVIDAHTRRFLRSLRRPEDLPAPHPDRAQNGLSYIHRTRRLIAYNLCEAGMERLRVAAPPYERFMLGARTMHEWGHLAADAGWIPVAGERARQHEDLQAQLAAVFEQIHRDAPAAVRAYTAREIERLSTGAHSLGHALARVALARFPDYQANLLARQFISVEERETYMRNNVYSLVLEYPSTALFQRLARSVYEYQYLRFSALQDPLAYFLNSTWFGEEYLVRRILTERQLGELLDTMGKICACYTIDWTKFTPEFGPSAA
jgi:hypothetical protein